jgi:glucuronoarabinoxylan endo-1,4-beta-xylanase
MLRRFSALTALVVVLAFAVFSFAVGTIVQSPSMYTISEAQTYTIDAGTVYQTIAGFGASSAGMTGSLTTEQARMFFSQSSGIGLSLLRIRMNPGGTTTETAIAQQAVALGATVWASPWTPPGAWKSNGSNANGGYLCDGIVCSPDERANYAAQFARFAASMQAAGVPLYAVSIQNEPDQSAPYVSCLWTPAEIEAFVPFLYTAFSNAGLSSVKIMLPECSGWELIPGYISWMATDTATAAKVGIIAGHNYDNAPGTAQTTYGLPIWETEYSTLDAYDGSMTNGIAFATLMHAMMAVANVNAYHYWWLIDQGDFDNEGLTDSNGNPAKRMYIMGNYSKFVRPGWQRIAATGSGTPLVSAYNYSDGSFAIVAINPDSDTSLTFSLSGLSAASVTPWVTSPTLSLAEQTPVAVSGSSFTYTLPATSVTTFYYDGLAPPGPSGSLTVKIGPDAAVSAGAMWSVDGGAWQTSGAAVSNLSVGVHTASFKEVQGWTTPSSQTFNISNGKTTSLTSSYVLTPPAVVSFQIDKGAGTTASRTVTLNNTATESPVYYMASQSSTFLGATWKPYSTAPSFTLSAANGTKTVYFKVKNAGGVSPKASASIVLAQLPAVTSFKINGGAATTINPIVTLNNTATISPTQYMASEDPSFDLASWLPYSRAPKFTLSPGGGSKTVYFQVQNSAGVSGVASATIQLIVKQKGADRDN